MLSLYGRICGTIFPAFAAKHDQYSVRATPKCRLELCFKTSNRGSCISYWLSVSLLWIFPSF